MQRSYKTAGGSNEKTRNSHYVHMYAAKNFKKSNFLQKIGNYPVSQWVNCGQGDQIGRIFAYWAIVYFGQFFYIQK
jgi:hypothetical protein